MNLWQKNAKCAGACQWRRCNWLTIRDDRASVATQSANQITGNGWRLHVDAHFPFIASHCVLDGTMRTTLFSWESFLRMLSSHCALAHRHNFPIVGRGFECREIRDSSLIALSSFPKLNPIGFRKQNILHRKVVANITIAYQQVRPNNG